MTEITWGRTDIREDFCRNPITGMPLKVKHRGRYGSSGMPGSMAEDLIMYPQPEAPFQGIPIGLGRLNPCQLEEKDGSAAGFLFFRQEIPAGNVRSSFCLPFTAGGCLNQDLILLSIENSCLYFYSRHRRESLCFYACRKMDRYIYN